MPRRWVGSIPPRKDLDAQDNGIQRIFQKYADDLLAIGRGIDEQEIRTCVKLIKGCRQAYVIAVGNTMPLALYMGFRLNRLGVRCIYDIVPEYYLNHINMAEPRDVLIALSQSGSSRQVLQGIELAREKGMKVIAITAYKHSPVSEMADHTLISIGNKESFNYYKNYAHLRETAVIDALL